METCPKCGFDRQPEHDECPKCGIVYEKYSKVVKHQEEQAKRPGRKPISKKDKIALFTVITFIGLIIAILMFNTIMKNMRIQREREAREREKEKIIETFAVSSGEILNQLESLIDKGKLALAEKEINKFDIPVLREVYPKIDSLKQRIYAEKIRNEHGTKANSMYKLTYDYAYKAGVTAGRSDERKGYAYSPEDTLNLVPIQMILNSIKEKAGYLLEDAAELGFNDGYIDGYKEGYY